MKVVRQLRKLLYRERPTASDLAADLGHARWQKSCFAALIQAGALAPEAPVQCFQRRSRLLQHLRTESEPAGLFVFPPHMRWHADLIQRTHHLARALARSGCRVVYITPSDKERIAGYIEIEPGLFLTNDDGLLGHLTGAAIHVPSTAWRFGPAEISRWRGRGNWIVYDYLDNIDDRITGAKTEATHRLLGYISTSTVDVAMASARRLREELVERLAPKPVAYVPNGVDFKFLRRSLEVSVQPPPEIAPHIHTGRPIIGYFGAIAPWLDYELIREAARLRPEWLYIFIGPLYQDRKAALPSAENVVRIPSVDYRLLPQYGRWFDIGIIPFAPGSIARTTSPLKFFEYMALGKPVVAHAAMLECSGFPSVYEFETAADFVFGCERGMAESSSGVHHLPMQRAAAAADWMQRAASVVRAVSAAYSC